MPVLSAAGCSARLQLSARSVRRRAYLGFLDKLFRRDRLASKQDEDLCDLCGHAFNPHELKGYGEVPLEGWMECPVDGCDCHRTWSFDEASRPAIEQHKRDNDLG